MVKLRWQRLDAEVWQARGFNVIYLAVRDGEYGFIAGVRRLQGRYLLPQAIEPLGTASTVQQARWLCEQHHGERQRR
jgi:hypothetical protein